METVPRKAVLHTEVWGTKSFSSHHGVTLSLSLFSTLQVKDRFCSLLSDQVASLQDRLRDMSLDEVSRAGADEEGKKPPPSQLVGNNI